MSETVATMQKEKKRPTGITGYVIKRLFRAFGTCIATTVMVGIITGCIVTCVLTVYILEYIGADEQINLDYYTLGYTSIIYATDSQTGESYELQRLYRPDNNRIWVDYSNISEYVKLALVSIEDKRFYEHEGVDWKRTFGAFANMFLPGASTGGGSTIHQQLIKNLTRDDEIRIDRKVREIFRAIDLSQRYTREQVLEAYLNTVPFGGGTNGIQSAANLYFGKDAADLTLAESASIVGVTQKPTAYNPLIYPEDNKLRQLHVLYEMHSQGVITQKQYDDAVEEELHFKTRKIEQTDDPGSSTQNYFVDHVINEVIDDLMEKYSWTETYATDQLYRGGYRIQITMDKKIQEHLEAIYQNTDQFPKVHNEEYPQSACIITDPNGKILALVGGIGKKEGARVFNRATMATRQPGSALKPLETYAVAFEKNLINWSYIMDDNPINIAVDGKPAQMWPRNHYGTYLGPMTIDRAIQKSTNTIPAKLVQQMTPQVVFDFLHDRLNFYSLVERYDEDGRVSSDIQLSPMTLGSLTHGVTGLEMAGGFQMYVNGGNFTEPYAYTEVRDSNDKIILKTDTMPHRVIGEDTAVLMNKLLQRVTNGPEGTGTSARLSNMPCAGKTGTSDDDINQWFIGITPYYVCSVWMGYDEERITVVSSAGASQVQANSIKYAGLGYPPPKLWKTIMEPLHEGLEYKQFMESTDVVSMTYCLQSGKIAASGCTSVASGWYKKNSIPSTCPGHLPEKDEEDEKTEDSSNSEAAPDDTRSIFDGLNRE